jgi:protoporphyrinogen oxidase
MTATDDRESLPVAVLGAGIAGLVAATELARSGVDVQVFEAGPRIAGLAATHHSTDGYTYDTGAHFVTNRLAAALGASASCLPVARYGEAVWLSGKAVDYPLGLMRVPRFVSSAVTTRLRHRGSTPVNAAEWFTAAYGESLAREVAIPLAEAWSGAAAEELSPAVGGKLGGVGRSLYLRVAGKISRRTVASGYSTEKPENAAVFHVYPAQGVKTLCEGMASALGPAVKLESPVERIIVDDGRAVAVRVAGEDVAVRAVVSTAPANVLPKLVEGAPVLDRFRPLRYRPMVFVNLKLRGRGLLPDVVTWFPDRGRPFFRLTEAPLSMPWLAPEGHTLVTADIGTEKDGPHWAMDDDALGELCVDALGDVIPDVRSRYLGCRVVRTPIAYPVFLNSYEPARKALETSTGVDNLLSVGRNGEFAHILMEDVYWRTRDRVRTWLRADESVTDQPRRPAGVP